MPSLPPGHATPRPRLSADGGGEAPRAVGIYTSPLTPPIFHSSPATHKNFQKTGKGKQGGLCTHNLRGFSISFSRAGRGLTLTGGGANVRVGQF